MNIANIKFILTGLILISPMTLLADKNSQMEQFFSEKILQVQNAVASANVNTDVQVMDLLDVNFDISSNLSFGISKVLNLTVSPEIDFVLTPSVSSGSVE